MDAIYKIWATIKSTAFMAVLALVSFCFAIYQTYYFEKKPEITISVNALSRVFDVYQSVGKLKIIYANEDLRVSKKQLWAMTITVSNSGNAGIKKGDFDEAVPFGLLFSDAEIVDVPAIKTANPYLDTHINIQTQRDRILFSPSIIEPQDSFQINVLLLGPQASIPYVSGIGKIAGITKFFVAAESVTGNKTTWAKITGAENFKIQLYRLIAYTIGGMLAFVALIGAIAMLSIPVETLINKLRIAKRRKRVSNFVATIADLDKGEVKRELRILCELYIKGGERKLADIKDVIDKAKECCNFIEALRCVHDKQLLESIVNGTKPLHRWLIKKNLEDKGIISFDGITPTWSETLESSLKKLAEYLEVDLDELSQQQHFERFVKNTRVRRVW